MKLEEFLAQCEAEYARIREETREEMGLQYQYHYSAYGYLPGAERHRKKACRPSYKSYEERQRRVKLYANQYDETGSFRYEQSLESALANNVKAFLGKLAK